MIEEIPRAATMPGRNGRGLLKLAQSRMAERYEREADRLTPLVDRWRRGELDDDRAVEEFLRIVAPAT
jgi:hypothetical protein